MRTFSELKSKELIPHNSWDVPKCLGFVQEILSSADCPYQCFCLSGYEGERVEWRWALLKYKHN